MGIKVNGKTSGFGTGMVIGSVTTAPVMSALTGALGNQFAQITGPIGYGVGLLVAAALGMVVGDNVFFGDQEEEEDS